MSDEVNNSDTPPDEPVALTPEPPYEPTPETPPEITAEPAPEQPPSEPTPEPLPEITVEPTPEPTSDPIPTPLVESPPSLPDVLINPPEINYSALTTREIFELNGDNVAQLHAALAAVAPITGVSGIGGDISVYSIAFAPEATDEQKALAEAVLRTWPQRSAILRKRDYNLQQLDNWFNAQIAAGYPTNFGFILGLGPSDITLLTGNYILAQAAASIGLDLPPIIDTAGQSQQIPDMQTLTTIMLEYGNYRSQLSEAYASKKAEILAASDALLAAI
jgi:hypothetical protein